MKIKVHLLIFLSIGILSGCFKPAPKIDAKESPAIKPENDLPGIIITAMDDAKINTHDLTGNIILILFQPDCDHCQREAKEIKEHLDAFKNYHLYFITSSEKEVVENFAKDYDLLGHSNIHFAFTSTDDILKNFGPIPAPSMYIYSQQQLIQQFNGETDIQKILHAL